MDGERGEGVGRLGGSWVGGGWGEGIGSFSSLCRPGGSEEREITAVILHCICSS